MSIFDQPKPYLDPDIFDKSEIVKPEVKQYIVNLLKEIFPSESVYRMIMIGSNTTYQYAVDSDIDVNVQGAPGETADKWHTIFKAFNNQNHLLPGTQHPVNYFFQEYAAPNRLGYIQGEDGLGRNPEVSKNTELTWANSLGAYDLLTDTWLKRPRPFEEIGDPNKTYAVEIAHVQMLMQMVQSEIDAVKQAIAAGDKARALMGLRDLQIFFHTVDVDRKATFQYGTGFSPSLEDYNLVYKLFEHSVYGKFLQDLVG